MKIISILLLTTLFMSTEAWAQTRPSDSGQGRGALIRNRIERFRANLDYLDLTSDQRDKVNALLHDTGEKIKDLADESDPSQRQAKVRDVMQDFRRSLATILTADQLQELRQKMQQNGGGQTRGEPTTAPATQPAAMMMQEDSGEKPKTAAVTPTGASASTPIETGKPAPEFKLFRLDGSIPIQLSAMKGHVVVLIFGSYTCPTFRDRSAALDRLYHDVQDKAKVFLVYTREAHPLDGWDVDRNKLDHIAVEQPSDEIGRNVIARRARESLHLEIPFLMDSFDNAVTDEYGGFPNAAVVIDRKGIVFGTEQWAEPTALKHLIDEAVAETTPTLNP